MLNTCTVRITSLCPQVLLRDCGKVDKLLGRAVEEQVITVVSSGSSLPIIDLTKVHIKDRGPNTIGATAGGGSPSHVISSHCAVLYQAVLCCAARKAVGPCQQRQWPQHAQ